MNDDAVFRALADASRRQLLDRLFATNGQTLGELCEGLDMTRQAVTKHLGILEDANLISVRRQGEPTLKSESQVMPNQYWRMKSGEVRASHSFCGVVRM